MLAVSAFPAAAANNYGGEIIFRIFLFALPFMAVAAAACFFPTPGRGWSLRSATLLALTTIVLVVGATLGNYGQEARTISIPAKSPLPSGYTGPHHPGRCSSRLTTTSHGPLSITTSTVTYSWTRRPRPARLYCALRSKSSPV